MRTLLDCGSELSLVRWDAISQFASQMVHADIEPYWLSAVVSEGRTASGDRAVLLPLRYGQFHAAMWCVVVDVLPAAEPLLLGRQFFDRYQEHVDFKNNRFHPVPAFARITTNTSSPITAYTPGTDRCSLDEFVAINYGAQKPPEDWSVCDEAVDDERSKLVATCKWYRQTRVNVVGAIHPSNEEMLRILGAPGTEFDNPVIVEGPDKATDLNAIPGVLHDLVQVFKEYEGLPPDRGEFNLRINLKPGAQPPATRAYRLSLVEEQELRKNLTAMIGKGHVVKSVSAFAAGVLFVTKGPKREELRMCFDYRRLNQVTIRDQFPLPLIKTLLDRLGGAVFFTALDLKSGYNQVLINPEDVYKAAFITAHGLYEPLVMPFGLCNAPALFQRMMTTYLSEEIEEGICVVYIDDILIYGGESLSEHKQHVRRVMQKLIDHQLTVKLSKCQFFCRRIDFLGHTISRGERRPTLDKVAAIRDWELPTTMRDLRAFLGLAEFYHDLIPRFSHLAAPLHELTKKKNSFDWTMAAWAQRPQAEEAFRALRGALTSGPVLRLIKKHGNLRVTVDASEVGIGAVLEQFQKYGTKKGKTYYPLAYFSRTIDSSQAHWPTRTKELFSLVESLKTWRHYLYGRQFEVRTDHSSLVRIPEQATFVERHATNERMLRMLEVVAAFHPKISYLKGSKNLVADALSRLAVEPIPSKEARVNAVHVASISERLRERLEDAWELHDHEAIDYKILVHLKVTPSTDQSIIDKARRFRYSDGLLWALENVDEEDSWILYAPAPLRSGLVEELHLRGHYGSKIMQLNMRQRWFWMGMTADVNRYVDQCDICKRAKDTTQRPQGEAQLIEVPRQPWTHVAMDFFSGYGQSKAGKGQVLLLVCMFSKMVKLYPLVKTTTTAALVEFLKEELVEKFLRGQQPMVFVSDRDKLFRDEWIEAWQPTKIRKASKAHPESDGMAERTIKGMKERLRVLGEQRKLDQLPHKDWEELLPGVELQHNATASSSTGSSPMMVVFGLQLDFDDGLASTDDERYLAPEEIYDARLRRYERCEQQLYDSQQTNQKVVNGRRRQASVFEVGKHVFVKVDVLFDIPQVRAGAPRYVGPVKILGVSEKGNNHITVEPLPFQYARAREVNIGDCKVCVSDCTWPNNPPLDKAQALLRLQKGDAYQFVRWELRKGDDKWLYVNWKGCNPAMISRFNKKDFNEQDYQDIAQRSPGVFEESKESQPVTVPTLPQVPDRIAELIGVSDDDTA